MSKNKLFAGIIFIITLVTLKTHAVAQSTSGLHNPVYGALGLSQGNAFVARADDASAISFNPAGLTQLKQMQISIGSGFIYQDIEYHGSEESETMQSDINTVPEFYIAGPLIKDTLAAGLGVTLPYGLNGEWDDDGFSRFVVTKFELQVMDVNPTISWRPHPLFSVGTGLNYYYATSELDKNINVSLLNSYFTGDFSGSSTIEEGFQDADTHGDGYGYNIGVLFTVTPKNSIGITFRSKADIDLDGKLRLSGLEGASAAYFGGSSFHTDFYTMITLPEMIGLGYAYRHGNKWSIEADVQWTNWSRIDSFRYDYEPTNGFLESNGEDKRNWRNTWGFGLGGEYTLTESLKIRGGYAFHESPVPSDTFEPSVPQSSRHGLFTGFGYYFGKNMNKNIDFAYGILFYENRKVYNSVGDLAQGSIDGRYESMVHIVAINFNYRF